MERRDISKRSRKSQSVKDFLLSLSGGTQKDAISPDFIATLEDLVRLKAVVQDKGIYALDSKYRAGKIDIAFSGTGFVQTLDSIHLKDLLVEARDTKGAQKDDLVIIKRLHSTSGRPKAKVIYIAKRANLFSLIYTKTQNKRIVGVNIKTALVHSITASQKSLKELPEATVLKLDNTNDTIIEVLGVLSDPQVDEKISMALFNKTEFFTPEAELEASSHGNYLDKSLYAERVDLTHLPFCTIDPIDAKDFDDAIYFDEKEHAIYVAIADVSEYLYDFGATDKEAKKRGFSIYFPHKSIPMLPRVLSENMCSLKPNEDRLAFTFKITLDKNSLEPLKEELLETIIHSKRRYNYDEIDLFLNQDFTIASEVDKEIVKYLLPLDALTKKLKEKRLKNSFEFSSSEVRMSVDAQQHLLSTRVEEQTRSHGLIEDCMLLANKAAAKRLSYGIFRTHGEPSYEKLEKLLNNLALVGIFAKFTPNLPELIAEIQSKARVLDISEEVDKLIIKSQQKAIYEPENKGHFGLGFTSYTHFTSPIRRYSDLTLHRLLKADLRGDAKRKEFLLRDIGPLCEHISSLERESDKVAWDYMDRKYARWLSVKIGENLRAIVTSVDKNPIVKLDDTIFGARIFLLDDNVELFEKIIIKIVEADIATTKVYARLVKRL